MAYPLLILAKLRGDVPGDDWWRVALGPAIFYGFLLVGMRITSRIDLRKAETFDELE